MQEQTLPEIEVIEENDLELNDIKLYSLVVFNDDINTFEYVIQTLVEVCEHSPDQAEQCTM
ncbi:MAG: ATP-dependent Clp protease adaptor ClpS, partial [Spirosomataceae bacterium]